jgi:hypothetical protein
LLRRAVVVVAGAVTLLAGCGPTTDASDASGRAPQGDVSPIDTLVPVLSQSDERTLWEAQRRLIRVCMSQRGLDFTFPSWEEQQAASGLQDQAVSTPRRAFADPAWAERHGYGFDPKAVEAIRGKHLGPESGKALDTETEEALYGAPGAATETIDLGPQQGKLSFGRDGCYAQTQQELFGDIRQWYTVRQVATNLSGQLHREAQADPAVAHSLQGWRDCMGSRGWNSFQQQGDAFARVAREYESKPDSARKVELDIATADAECTVSSGYAKALEQSEKEVAEAAKGEVNATILSYLRMRSQAIGRANSILSAS